MTTSRKDAESKPRRLGRGLSVLLSPSSRVEVSVHKLSSPDALPSSPTDKVRIDHLNIESCIPNKYQPRIHFDERSLVELADSIRQAGVIQPIIVRALPGRGTSAGAYEIVAGERRWRAAQLAGLVQIPAIVHDLSDEESAQWALVENLQREDLNAIERARAFQSLSQGFSLTHGQVAERVGLDRSSVANFIRLLELEDQIQQMIAVSRLSYGHGKVLLGLAPGPARVRLAEQCVREGWNIRRLERAISEASRPAPTPSGSATPLSTRSASLEDLEKRLGEYLGTKVVLHTDRSGSRGRLVFEFYGLDHFDGMMSKIGFSST